MMGKKMDEQKWEERTKTRKIRATFYLEMSEKRNVNIQPLHVNNTRNGTDKKATVRQVDR